METIDLNQLAVFAAVAETQSFSAAAKRLGLPKSSVSRSVATLEQAVGVRLLHRTTRQVSLSTAGSALLERVAPALASLREAVGQLPELEEQPSGRLRITAPVDLGSALFAEIVARFAARHPAVELELNLTNTMVDLVSEGFDLALRIMAGPLKDSTLTARNAGRLAAYLFAAPAYLLRRGTPRSPADLEGHDWVLFRSGQWQLEGPGGQTVEIAPRGRIRVDDMSFVREAVRQGAGMGVLPAFLAAPDVAAGDLVRVLPRWDVRSGDLWIVSPSARHQPRKVTAFRDFLLESLQARSLVG